MSTPMFRKALADITRRADADDFENFCDGEHYGLGFRGNWADHEVWLKVYEVHITGRALDFDVIY